MDGSILRGDNKPSSEIIMHLSIYKKRKDVNGIIHTHSPVATGFSFARKKLKRLEGFGNVEKTHFPLVGYEKPGSRELAKNTLDKMKTEDAVLLEKHGVVAVSAFLDEAALLAEFIENTAKTQFVAHLLSLESTPIRLKHSK
jgi:L-fuculose-phosphate aldolase